MTVWREAEEIIHFESIPTTNQDADIANLPESMDNVRSKQITASIEGKQSVGEPRFQRPANGAHTHEQGSLKTRRIWMRQSGNLKIQNNLQDSEQNEQKGRDQEKVFKAGTDFLNPL